MPCLRINHLNLSYDQVGQGPNIVCIHGWASSRRMWRQTITHLSAHHRVLALDLPGFGDSDKPAHGYTIAGFADTLRTFCLALATGEVALIGHSMGGMIALQLALDWPQVVNRLVLANATVTGRLAYGLNHALRHPVGRSLLMRTHHAQIVSRWGQNNLELLGHPSVPLVRGTYGVTLRRSLEDFNKTTSASAIGCLAAIMNSDMTDSLAQIGVPTLVIVGDRDRTVPVSDSYLLASRIPGAQLAVMAGTSHLPMDERPAEFSALLEGFFRAD